ncbi:MAG: SDR family NAD(P)-dependent oxidoreductase [Thermoanaerobaculia bacterium]
MTRELEGRVAVVTGSSGSIGSVICEALRDRGATVVGLDVSHAGSGVEFERCDLSDDGAVGEAITRIDRTHGRIDIAVHCAGISRDAVIWKLAVEEWDAVQTVNLRGAFLLIRHAIPVMRRIGGGRIVLIGSINGSRGKRGTSAYAASKAGLIGLAKSVSREAGRFGILVNVVEPGWVRTSMTEGLPAEVRKTALNETLTGEFVEPDDVAAAVVYLSGLGGRRVTGQILRVDAGQYLGS